MDLRTGKTYDNLNEALMAGVPRSDLALITGDRERPIIKFTKGSFKTFVTGSDGKLVVVRPARVVNAK